ncbi:hypothetical protein PCASD_04476 [Puccinia coronata f. sp. avenae]|uniref:Tyr recombinase domain-containing protein n=1 Tax=Puccinia coronata f. sp. avenae TaxID=200324 RepID=A0A2N5V307_9BASI|nr:hypothetical protein PCASD_04476 [Puccinia coronata f. sp. avenae]
MNIERWEQALKANGLIKEFQDVIHGLKHGFHQGIPEHGVKDLPYYTPPNHKSASEARQKIEDGIEKELKAKRMFGPFQHKENFRTTWDDFRIVASFLRNRPGPVHLGIFDWAKAYRQIPTAPSQWPYLMKMDFEGNLYLDTRIAFRGNSGPPKEKGELLVQDVAFRLSRSGDPRALITPREAKTSKLGEEQMLRLLHQNNLLCPVMAVRRRISEARSPTNTLLGFYLQDGTRYNLTKSWVRHVLQGAWKKGNYKGISGHSFRVGGASLRFALDIPVEEIMKLGCWVLDCYKLYIQEYTKALLAQLEACWCNANQTC